MRRISKGATKRLASTVVRLTLEGDLEGAQQVAETLATFDNVQRLPGFDGQPGFGRGWGFGDPYDEVGYGRAAPKRKIPNTGDLPTTFDEEVEKRKKTVERFDEEYDDLDLDDLEIYAEDLVPLYDEEDDNEDDDEEIVEEPDDILYSTEDFDMDVVFASAVEKVSSLLGEDAAIEFKEVFGILEVGDDETPSRITAEVEDDEDAEDEVEEEKEEIEVEEETEDDDDEIEEEKEKKPRNRREVMQVWREDLIPDVTPIIRRVLKHVSVQYSLPYSTLTNALRVQDSPVAGMLADALEGLEPEDS